MLLAGVGPLIAWRKGDAAQLVRRLRWVAIFALIGAHGVHVLGAVVWLLTDAVRGIEPMAPPGRLAAGALYWYFVCALWLAIVAVVYL